MPDLLIELLSEEIPARMQRKAATDLQKIMTDGLVEAGLTYEGAAAFATPRRLALHLQNLSAESPTVTEERKGPRTDAPEKAIEGFLRSTGLAKDDLEVRDDKKGQVYFARITRPGRPAAGIVAETLDACIRNFPWQKSMRWGDGALRWVRPLHSVLVILTDEAGAAVVPFDIDGLKSGDTTRGHWAMSPDAFSVTGFDDYEARLAKSHVILRSDARAEHIWAEASNAAFATSYEVVEDKGLLDEVAGLVEYPVVLIGDIGAEFLDLPPEVLQTSMREHQKFFSIRNPKTGRIEKFATVANRTTADNGATILAGNGKVLTARLADAKFFWDNDLRVAKAGMNDWLGSLKSVTFHNKLGTVSDKIDRVAALAREIAPRVGADADLAEQAARIAKADLSSEMVYEFPELQGTMGKYYAKAAGLPDDVARAAEAHYAPLGPSGDVPTEPVSVAVALADKIDTLTGFWSIDEKPTGSKDPFALRRAALGVIRIILENGLNLTLAAQLGAQFLAHEIVHGFASKDDRKEHLAREMMEEIMSRGVFGAAWDVVRHRFDDDQDVAEFEGQTYLEELKDRVVGDKADLLAFIHDRLKVHLRGEGLRHDVIDAAIAMPGADDLTLLVKRARALQEFLSTADGENLLQGYKRANNILTAEEKKDGVFYELDPDPKLAEDAIEKALFDALDTAEPAIAKTLDTEDFAAAMTAMAALRAPIDAFFEDTLINSENSILRRNRLCLLNRIRSTMNRVAVFENLEG